MKALQYGSSSFDASFVDQFRKAEQKKYTEEYFRKEYWKEDLPGQSGNRSLSYDDADHTKRFSILWQAVERLAPAGSLLDVGCGPGHLVERALQAKRDVVGVDCSESAVRAFHSRTGNRWEQAVSVGEAHRLEMPTQSVDVVLCFDTLEHLVVFDIFAAVGELARTAKQRVIATINIDNPYEYHPTVLSRSSWIAIFEGQSLLRLNERATATITDLVCRERPEYDFFVFDRLEG